MEEHQFRTLLANRRPWSVPGLLAGDVQRRILVAGERALRSRERAQEVLDEILPAGLRGAVRVEGLCRGQMRVAVSDRVVFERLRAEQGGLMRAVRERVPGVQGLHFVLRSGPARREAAPRGDSHDG